MPRHGPPRRTLEFSPEEVAMNRWLEEEGDYVRLERRRRTIELEVAVGLDVLEPKRADRELA
jgi:hypothetical protein